MIIFCDHFHFINACEPTEALLRENSPVREIGPAFRSNPKPTAAAQREGDGIHTSKPDIASDSFSQSGGVVIILLIVLILLFGFGGYRLGPGVGYYGGGSISLILLIVLILLLLRVI
jgi:hypothetical protein